MRKVGLLTEETQQATLSLLRDNKSYADKVSKGNFLDPVWYIFLYIPISFIPYPVAKAIWITLLQVSVAVSIHLALELSGLNLSFIEKFITVLLGVLFYVFVRDYIAASMLPFFMMLSLLGVKFALDRQSVQAGFLIGCLGQSGLYIPDHFPAYCSGRQTRQCHAAMPIVGLWVFDVQA